MPRLLERINFPKVVTILASTFGIALGACGLTALASSRITGGGGFLLPLAFIELGVMILSAVGLVLTVLVWIIASILGYTGSHGSEPQQLFHSSSADDEEKRD
jgi:hypothetical protein